MGIVGFIVLGDRTSHGGVVATADPTFTIDGQPVARIGDKVTCPRCARMVTIVTSRFPTAFDLGKAIAYDQDKTDCGASIYSRHNGHSGWGETDAGAPTPADILNANLLKASNRFQEHFILHDNETGEPMAGVPYVVRTGDGKRVGGVTDTSGRTEVIWTESPMPVEVTTNQAKPEQTDPYHYGENMDYGGL